MGDLRDLRTLRVDLSRFCGLHLGFKGGGRGRLCDAGDRAPPGGPRSRRRALFTFAFISGSRGSARIERLPSARGPNSIRPWNQPRIFPFESSSAAVEAGSASLVYRNLYVRSAFSTASSSKQGPQYPCRIGLFGNFPPASRKRANPSPSAAP